MKNVDFSMVPLGLRQIPRIFVPGQQWSVEGPACLWCFGGEPQPAVGRELEHSNRPLGPNRNTYNVGPPSYVCWFIIPSNYNKYHQP